MIVFAIALMSAPVFTATVFTATAIADNNFTENPMPYMTTTKTLGDYTYEDSHGSYREGDIIYHREEWPGHMGIIVKDDKGGMVVREAHPDVAKDKYGKDGGTGYTPIDEFYKRYDNKEVFILRVDVDDATAKKAADFAKEIEGPFSANPFNENGWYCSELVYESYKSVGIDISSKDPQIPIKDVVTPKDIYEKPQTDYLPDGPTPGPDPWGSGGEVNPVEDGGLIESGPLNITPNAFLGEGSSFNVPLQFSPLLTLQDIIPTIGPEGTIAINVTPAQPLGGGTNAVDAAAVNFVDTVNPSTKAVVAVIKTINRTYEHDYSVCGRFHGYKLESASVIPFVINETNVSWFWCTSARKGEILENAMIFSVFVDEDQSQFTVDSQWLYDNYPNPIDNNYDYALSFQIWASSFEEAYNLLQRTLENLENYGTVSFTNIVEPIPPSLFIKSAEYSGGNIKMEVQSWRTENLTVQFFGSIRYLDNRTISVPFEYNRTIELGTNIVELPAPNMLDAVVLTKVNDFLDKVYAGGGFWFVFSDPQSNVTLVLENCTQFSSISSNDLSLAGCAKMIGNITTPNGYVGIAQGLNPNGRPIDVSQHQVLTFYARGDGKSYSVKIETDSVDDYDHHQFIFTASEEGRQFVIPLSSFIQQGWGKPIAFTGKDVKIVSWVTASKTHDNSVNLFIDNTAFFNSVIISNTTVLPNTDNVTGPYIVTANISDDIRIENASLFYSVDSRNFTEVPMTANGSILSAQIPGQSLDIEVRYYVEAADADGNIATDPVDIPYTTYRFQVSEHPYLLVDDFSDYNPTNTLGDNSWLFHENGTVAAYYDKELLQLDYNALSTDSYAGYATSLGQVDLTQYSLVSLMVKGANGGEVAKIGLRDSSGNEPKIVLSEYLPQGITTSWQKVRIPLAVFTRVANGSSMERFVIAFENRVSSGVGTIYLDDIKFEQIHIIPIMVDNFNDMTGENGLGGSLWTSTGGGATMDTAYDQEIAYGDTGAGYRIAYSGVTGTAWAASGTDLMWLDASEYDTLSLCIKGAKGGEKPNVYLSDGFIRKFVDIEDYVPVTASWQKVDIPLKDFAVQGVNITSLSYFQVVFEWEEMNGTIYLDDIQFHITSKCLDTGSGTYPSISGTHNGTIKPSQTITVSKLYTYPCSGTGGHSEYARIWNSTWEGVEAY